MYASAQILIFVDLTINLTFPVLKRKKFGEKKRINLLCSMPSIF